LLKLTASEVQKQFHGSDYVISYGPGEYVVDGRPFKEQKLICGPARSNDKLDIFNCCFVYNSTYKRIELFTKAPMTERFYEALTNYDTPGRAPCN
jgi:hypothetical protein